MIVISIKMLSMHLNFLLLLYLFAGFILIEDKLRCHVLCIRNVSERFDEIWAWLDIFLLEILPHWIWWTQVNFLIWGGVDREDFIGDGCSLVFEILVHSLLLRSHTIISIDFIDVESVVSIIRVKFPQILTLLLQFYRHALFWAVIQMWAPTAATQLD